MRFILLIMAAVLTTAAAAQDDAADLACQAKPDQVCVLEMAGRAANAAQAASASGKPQDSLERIVQAAARSGHFDLALSLGQRLDEDGGIGLSALARAAAKADRLAELVPLLARLGYDETEYLWAIAPMYAANGREAELAELIARAKPAPRQDEVTAWRVEGELREGRPENAVDVLNAMGEAERSAVVDHVVRALVDSADGQPKLALALATFLVENYPHQLIWGARMAIDAADLGLARSLAGRLADVPGDSRDEVQKLVAIALAAAGDWEQAVELANNGLEPREARSTLVFIAVESREPKLFPLVEKALAEAENDDERADYIYLLIRPLVSWGMEPAAQAYVDASSQFQRDDRVQSLAIALAEVGRFSDAVRVARSLENPAERAWAVCAVAWWGKWPDQ